VCGKKEATRESRYRGGVHIFVKSFYFPENRQKRINCGFQMKYYEENSAAMSEDENLDVESDVSVDLVAFLCKRIFLK
jgi:hypothetical protein